MISDSQVIATYKRMSSDELIELAGNPAHLRPEVIPLLANELRSRSLDVFADELVSSKKEPQPDDIVEEGEEELASVTQEVKERIGGGESIESIKADLNERGINIFDLLDKEVGEEDAFFDKITQLKREGISNETLQQKLVAEEQFTEEGSKAVITKLKDKAKKNIIYGTLCFFVAAFIILYTMEEADKYGSGTILIPYGLLLYGLIRLIRGIIQRRS